MTTDADGDFVVTWQSYGQDGSGAGIYAQAQVQVEELLAWRKAGAWNRAILAVGGLTTVERVRHTLASGVDVAMVGTAALTDPLIAARTLIETS